MAPTHYRTIVVDGLNIFYREAGQAEAPAILLLHGFPSSSRMWQPLIDRLADRYRMIAPDYPGFGQSDAPSPAQYRYTFDHLAETMQGLLDVLGIGRHVLFMQDGASTYLKKLFAALA